MPASFTLPPNDPYQGTAYPLQSRLLNPPSEGRRMIPVSINWGNDSPTNQAIGFNLQNNTTNPFSQICAAYIDNLMSNVDVVLMFPDTASLVTVPAQSAGWYPLDTNALNFVIRVPAGQTGTASDETFINIYNYMPPPITVERTFVTSVAGAGTVPLTTHTTQVIAAGINGVITAGMITVASAESGGGGGGFWGGTLQDGDGNVLATIGFGIPIATSTLPSAILWQVSGVNIPFTNGVRLVAAATGTAFASGDAAVNLYYR